MLPDHIDGPALAVDVDTLGDIVMLSARDSNIIPNFVRVRGIDHGSHAYKHGEVAASTARPPIVETLARRSKRRSKTVFPQTPLALASRPLMH